MLMSLEEAGRVFCTPDAHILKKLTAAKRLTKQHDGVIYVQLPDVAHVLHCPADVVQLLIEGKEWLLREDEIETTYGLNSREARRVAGDPLFTPHPYHPVFRASEFIKWAKLDPVERSRLKEAGSGNGQVRRAIQGGGHRGKVRRPRQDNPAGDIE